MSDKILENYRVEIHQEVPQRNLRYTVGIGITNVPLEDKYDIKNETSK